ncbi:MAG TPA: DUF5715 family protein [Pyrinomonadaceae bacterium]
MKEKKGRPAFLIASLLFVVIVAALLALPGLKKRGRAGYAQLLPAPVAAEAAEISTWTQAAQKVKEDRGEPTGKQAKVETPQQLRHYSDTRRFLAIQHAEWREHRFETPKDFVDLANMIRSGEMVSLPAVSRDYILFGVGGNTDKGPFTRYENGKRVELYNESELALRYDRTAESLTKIENEVAGLRQELSSLKRHERSRRVRLQAQIGEKEKALKAERESKELLDRYYGDARRRQELFSNYQSLADVARSFPDRDYDMEDARSRQEMKTRLLSSLRPEALKVLEEVALAYRQKFNRPLPITSLVRPDEYQHALSKVNPNATLMETPPHSTGLAFDISYQFMTAEEQSFVMAHLARLEDEGRIEVLRENRNHYHVFAFIDGARPDEALIRASLGNTKATKDTKEMD